MDIKKSKERSHVHFDNNQNNEHDAEILVVPVGQGKVEVHLGFLKLHHRYELEFDVKDTLGPFLTTDPSENPNVHVISTKPLNPGHHVVIGLNACRDGLLAEEVTLYDSKTRQELVLVLQASIIDKHKGTPALKNGIKCLSKPSRMMDDDLATSRSRVIDNDED